MSSRDPARFARLRAAYDELAELPPDERLARLDDLRRADPELHGELVALLGAEGAQRPSVLERERALEALGDAPPAGAAAGHRPAGEEIEPGTRLGPYRVVRPLGSGGMGAVYEAEQREPLVRTVAIKVLRPELASPDVVGRFAAERQTLAVMEHPNIARMLDAGMTDEGRPWFAMERVAGVPVTRWARQRDLDLEQRIALMLPICDALQHSHLKGVVHRDLKPSNVLVAEDESGRAVPKVIDFGIAKVLERASADGPAATRFGELIGTPESMSPEQATLGAVDVDTRSDVYALGLLLYELVTGDLPPSLRDLRSVPFDEVCRRIREVDPPRPSVVLARRDAAAVAGSARSAPRRSRRSLTDLDAVLSKALAKDREARYQTPAALADDLRRFLRHEVVEAVPPSWRRRARQLVRRHRTAAAFAALALASLLGGLVATTTAWIGARRAEDRAVAARQRAETAQQEALDALRTSEEASEFLVDLFRAADPRQSPGLDATASELLERGLERIDALSTEPRVQARLLETLGEVSWSSGAFDRAEPLLRRALELRRGQAPDPRREAAILGRLGTLHRDRAELAEAAAAHREAIGVLEAADLAESREMGGALNSLATVLRRQGEVDAARRALARSIELTERLEDEPSGNLATSFANLGALHHSAGDPDASLAATRRAIELFAAVLPESHPNFATLYNNVGLVSRTLGRLGEAKRASEKALAVDRAAFPEGHPTVADTLHGLGSIEWRLGDLDAARAAFEEGLALLRASLGPGHFRTTLHRGSLGSVALVAGDSEGALAHLDPVIAELAASDDPRADRHAIGYLRQRATALRRLGRLDEARAALDRAMRLAEGQDRSDDVAILELHAALVELDRGRPRDADALFAAASAVCEPTSPCALDAATSLAIRAHWHARRGETDDAFRTLALAVEHADWTAWMLDASDLDPLRASGDERWLEAESALVARRSRAADVARSDGSDGPAGG